jgi:hypothetical protein
LIRMFCAQTPLSIPAMSILGRLGQHIVAEFEGCRFSWSDGTFQHAWR